MRDKPADEVAAFPELRNEIGEHASVPKTKKLRHVLHRDYVWPHFDDQAGEIAQEPPLRIAVVLRVLGKRLARGAADQYARQAIGEFVGDFVGVEVGNVTPNERRIVVLLEREAAYFVNVEPAGNEKAFEQKTVR